MKSSWRIFAIVALVVALAAVNGCRALTRSGDTQIGESEIVDPLKPGIDPTQTIDPLLATIPPSATPSPDLTPTATLEPFSPLSASAADCDYGGAFKSIAALDRYTVHFSLCRPEPAFLSKIAFPTFTIQPRYWLESTGGGGEGSLLLERPVGTGPYQVEIWNRGEELVFKAFPAYWGDVKSISSTLIFRWDRDEVQRLLELQTGVADGMDNLSSADFSTVETDSNLTLVQRAPLSVLYLGINNSQPPMDDERVRQAIALGLDRDQLLADHFPEGYQRADYFTPCIIPDACPGDPWYEFDPQRAKALLVEAGYQDGFQIELVYQDVVRGYLPRPGAVAGAIKKQLWENLGINLKLVVMDTESFYNSVDSGLINGIYLLGWGADYPHAINFLEPHFGRSATAQFGNKFDDLVVLLDQAIINPGDTNYVQDANRMLRQYVPMIPLAHGAWFAPDSLAVAYKQTVEGGHASPFGHERFADIHIPGQETFVWIQSMEPISLYCADETDSDSLRACAQVTETLYRYGKGGVTPQPALAQSCTPNQTYTEWTCNLQENVMFHDGSYLDANDVVMSFLVQWDAAHPLHRGNSGSFHYFYDYWGDFLNRP